MLTSHQLSDLQSAVEDAHSFSNRRRSPRFAHACNAEMSLWENNRAGMALGVVVENLSTTGVAIRHTGRLKEGAQYLLEIPRPGMAPLATLLTVVRCAETDGGWFDVEMTPDAVLEVAASRRRNSTASRTKMGLVFLAFAASAIAMFAMML
jgi:hypothetical protein